MNSFSNYQSVDSYWYNQIPSSWNKTKNKFVFTQKKVVVGEGWEKFTLLTMGKSGVKPRDMDAGGKFPESFENYQTVNPNQIIFCLFDLDETPRTVGLSKDHGMITSAYDVFSTNEEHDPQFWTYFYQMIDDHKGLRPYYTGLRKVVRYDTFMGIEVFAPPLNEQKLIARYLEKKTDQIDRLVEKIQKKIELLKEQRTSLINHYVTKGLDPNVEMKDSGVDGVGVIPKHWKVKSLWTISKRKSLTNSNDLPLLSVYLDAGVVRFADIDQKRTNVTSEDLSKYQRVDPGDFVLNNQQAWRGSVGVSKYLGIVSPAYIVLEISNELDNGFADYLLRDRSMVSQYRVSSKGIGSIQRNLFFPHLRLTKVFIPSIEEQKLIVRSINYEINRGDQVTTRLERKIELLSEYRQSLISSAVTGKIRITEEMI